MNVELKRRPPGLERIAPLCEMLDCPNRADYFWLLLPTVANRLGWCPVCHQCASEFGEDLILEVVPIAESSVEARHHPPLKVNGSRTEVVA